MGGSRAFARRQAYGSASPIGLRLSMDGVFFVHLGLIGLETGVTLKVRGHADAPL